MKTNMKPETIADKLGVLRAELAKLKSQEESLKDMLIESGVAEVEGRLFRAMVLRNDVTLVDYKGLVKKLEPSPQLLTAYSKTEERVQVRVAAR